LPFPPIADFSGAGAFFAPTTFILSTLY
jgi:hypothetical protein